MASAKMALFVGALSFEVRSIGGVFFAVRSFPRRVFCGSVHWGCRLCSSILSEARLLPLGPLGASYLRFDPFGGMSFAVRSVEGVISAVGSVRRRVFCGSVR
jgi:hypothetical protein